MLINENLIITFKTSDYSCIVASSSIVLYLSSKKYLNLSNSFSVHIWSVGCTSIKICVSFLSWFAHKHKLGWYYNINSTARVLRTERRTLNLRRFRYPIQLPYYTNINKEWLHCSWLKRF